MAEQSEAISEQMEREAELKAGIAALRVGQKERAGTLAMPWTSALLATRMVSAEVDSQPMSQA